MNSEFAWTAAVLGLLLVAVLAGMPSLLRRERERSAQRMREFESAARLDRERLEYAARAGNCWLWETDAAGNVVWSGGAVDEVFGRGAGDVQGRRIARLGLGAAEDSDRTRAAAVEIESRRPDGQTVILSCTATPVLDEQGRVIGRRGACRPVTRGARIADELLVLGNEVSEAERAGIVEYVLSSLAHELNQPLAAVSAYCDASARMLRDNPVAVDTVLPALAAASHQARAASEVVKRLRGFLLRREPSIAVSSVSVLVENALALADIRLESEGVSIERKVPTDLPAVRVDSILIVQVMLNLLHNAIDAMSGRKRRVVTISAAPESDAWVRLSIADTGAGIPEDKLTQVLDAYFTTKPDGLGLGLSICVSILEAHGSTLALSRNESGGCTAVFRLEADTVH